MSDMKGESGHCVVRNSNVTMKKDFVFFKYNL